MPTADSSNANCTVAEAELYFAARLYKSAWTAASTSDKNIALIWATRILDEQMEWLGSVAVYGQAMQWPRNGLLDVTGTVIGPTTIPQKLKDATAEFGMWLIQADRTKDSSTVGLSEVKAGSLDIKFNTDDPPPKRIIPDYVVQMLALWGRRRFSGADSIPGGMVSLRRS